MEKVVTSTEEYQTLVRCSNPVLELKITCIIPRYMYTHNKLMKRETNVGTWHIYNAIISTP
jgi:hypothetical protein